MSSKKEDSITNLVDIKAYIPTKEHSPEDLVRFNALIQDHPSRRTYLTHKEYTQEFAPDKKKADVFLNLAKENKWKVSQNKKTREINIKITHSNEKDSDTLTGLKYLTTNGDIHLESNNIEANSETTEACIGFVKHNVESRVGNRRAIPIQEEIHGHSVLEVAEAYNFPNADGEGETIGIIELGGEFNKEDLEQYFAHYNLDVPKIQVVGKPNNTGEKNNTEVTADIQVAGVLAPKAKLVIYYGDTILEAIKSALSDGRNKLSVISISWAGSELGYSRAELNALDEVFYEAALKGITVVAASGDNGAFNNKTYPNVNVPANFSHVLGCGGSKLEMSDEVIAAETVWNESNESMQISTGGGFSERVSLASYQQKAVDNFLSHYPQFLPYNTQKGRSIPDVAANASDASGYSIFINGQWSKIGGTSLATPLWAALIARLNQNLGYQLGFINAHLYEMSGSSAFHPIVEGNNNLYIGALFWNPCTGLGTPNGVKLQEAIEALK